MKTIQINLYSFNELTDKAKQKVIEKFADINTDYEWWDFTVEDAKEIGLNITSFELYHKDINAKFINSALETSAKIIQEHGVDCATYKTALQFSTDYDSLVAKYSDGIDLTNVTGEKEYDFDQEDDKLKNDFLNSLCNDYFKMLLEEYEYATSEEAIIETIKSNEYFFTENGILYKELA